MATVLEKRAAVLRKTLSLIGNRAADITDPEQVNVLEGIILEDLEAAMARLRKTKASRQDFSVNL